ncbi:MAG: protein kinase, partial [Ilumatobacteraceae bacterium]|nr:protein kinase [Ilumatobacteraceae bacterium]
MQPPRPSTPRRATLLTICSLLVGVVAGASIVGPGHARADAPLGTITTVVGTIGDGGPAANAYIDPKSLATDPAGNLYVAEPHRVRKIAAVTHVITTIAGNGLAIDDGDGGPAVVASLSPRFVTVAANGDLYISSNQRVRKITVATGIITTFAGTGGVGTTGDGGPATAATFMSPAGLAIDSAGNLYIADSGAHRVRKVATDGKISLYAGTGSAGFTSDNVVATTSKLSSPNGLAIDPTTNFLYIADTGNSRIRKVTPGVGGVITTVAGSTAAGYDGEGTGKKLNQPLQVAYASDVLYVTDTTNQRLRRVGLILNSLSTLAGNGTASSTGDGGQAALATLDYPRGLAVFESGGSVTAYVTDDSSTIRAVTGIGTATVRIDRFAGIGAAYAGDGGPATAAIVGGYLRFATAPNGDLIIADGENNRVRRVAHDTGMISTIAGTGTYGYNGDGPALTRNIAPNAIAVDGAGNVYIGLDKDSVVLKLTVATGMV